MESSFLTSKDAKREDAVEVFICEKLNKMPKNRVMSEDDMSLLVKLNSFEMKIDEDTEFAVDDLYKKLNGASLPMKVFESRLDKMGIEMTKGVKIMMGCLMQTPGIAILYVCFFLKWCKDNDTTKVTLEDWCIKMFPLGVFQEEGLQEVWESQKVKRALDEDSTPDNLVDQSTAFKSLEPTVLETSKEEDEKS